MSEAASKPIVNTEPETPCIIIDKATMERNIRAMAEVARSNQVQLRPHAKTHKLPWVAHQQLQKGVTEIRPGTYVYQDRMQARLGVCSLDDCAGMVWVTVISRPSADLAVIDDCSKTFATDVQPNVEPLMLQGFGHVDGLDDAVLERLSEEHGMLRLGPNSQNANLQIGSRLRIIPNHICSTVNLHNKVFFRNGAAFEEMTVLGRGMLE
jgi:D-serine deaminase-like pyridoxal phosphate-dependent protein